MRRRRARTKSGQAKPAPAAAAEWDFGGSDDFPVDEVPPDELPSRDINEDLEDRDPADQAAVTADEAVHDQANSEPGIGFDPAEAPGVADRNDPGEPEAVPAREAADGPVPERSEPEATEQQSPDLLPDLFSGDAPLPHEGQGRAARRRRPQGSGRRAADAMAAQLELWPDAEPAGAPGDPRRGRKGDSDREG